jgi:hypothetical protein
MDVPQSNTDFSAVGSRLAEDLLNKKALMIVVAKQLSVGTKISPHVLHSLVALAAAT